MKQQRKPKYFTRAYTRCKICGRPHSAKILVSTACRVCSVSSIIRRNHWCTPRHHW
ncbi:MAG: hypothetical protein FRC54_00130 [bacterium LCO1.1]|uniref:30S ribosomal protein S14 n=1 Tax=Candidatus Weimeria bifida TaxID=2599074 RepID=A0A6N7IVX7_9FIRM|nr:hypothetical protein [Candidatus Weimeria bifida]